MTLLLWPILVHSLFTFTDVMNRWDRMFHHHIFVRIFVFIGAAMWLMKASLTTNFERTTRALSQSLAETFEGFGLQGWLSAKISRFIISVITGLSRTTLALAAVNFGVRVLPYWWSLELTTSDPYFKLLDLNGDGVITANEVYGYVFQLSNRIWQALMTSIVGFQLLSFLKPPTDSIPWSEVKERAKPLQTLSKIVIAMQNPRNAELRVLARRVTMASRIVNFFIVMAFFVWPWAFLFGLRPRLIFAFGGVGGLAVGLAARNMVGNLIASFLIQLNRPFVEGDEIEDAKKNLIGVVEEVGIINTHVNSREGVLVHVPNQTLLDDIVVNKSMRDFRPIEESVHLIPSSVPDLPKLIQEIQQRLESFEGLLQEDDVRRLIRLRGGRIKLFRPLCMFDGYCDLGLKLKIYAFARGSLSRRSFAALKSQVLCWFTTF